MGKGVGMASLSQREKDWQAENDLNTLIEAEKIKKDPARLKAVMARKKELQKALDGVKK